MPDHVPLQKRSQMMAAVKSKDTAPEVALRKRLHAMGYRYRLQVGELPGRPDIVFPARKKVIFVNGCFWHRHAGCRYSTTPRSRPEFWRAKFDANVSRDARNIAALHALEWDTLVVWQCELKRIDPLMSEVVGFLENE